MDQTPVRLVYAITTDAEIADGFVEMGGQHFLPGLAVVYLMALREAVPVSINPAWAAGAVQHSALAGGLIAIQAVGAVEAVSNHRVRHAVPQFGIEIAESARGWVQQRVNVLLRQLVFLRGLLPHNSRQTRQYLQ